MRCDICEEIAVDLLTEKHPGYMEELTYKIFECQYCDTQFVNPKTAPENLYESIYTNSDRLPGYDRYHRFATQIKDVDNPLIWLSHQEKAYEFVYHFLRRRSSKGIRILEVGCGLGYLTYALRSAGYNAFGCDLSSDAIKKARSYFGDYYYVADATDIQSLDAVLFDVIVLTELIEHVSDPVSLLSGLKKRLSKGGTILMTTPNKTYANPGAIWETENPPVHLWWFSETGARRMAERAGLEIHFHDFSGAIHASAARPPFLAKDGHVILTAEDFERILAPTGLTGRIFARIEKYSSETASKIRLLRDAVGPAKTTARAWQMGAILTLQQCNIDTAQ